MILYARFEYNVVNDRRPNFRLINTPFWLTEPPFVGVLTDYTFHSRSFHKLETNLKRALVLVSFWFIYWIFSGSSFLISDFIFYIVVTAIATVVSVAEILKNYGLAVEKSEILCLLWPIVSRSHFSFRWYSNNRTIKLDLLNLYAEIRTSTVVLGNPRGRAVQKARVRVIIYILSSIFKDPSLWVSY